MGLVKTFGEMWARNAENVELVPGRKHGGQGIYVLYDGSMPVYIGMGNIKQRLNDARHSGRRGQMWDHFSWYIPSDQSMTRDMEALMLRMLPLFLRILNRQQGKLLGATENKRGKKNWAPEHIMRAKLLPRRR